jgi:hypothetical protein
LKPPPPSDSASRRTPEHPVEGVRIRVVRASAAAPAGPQPGADPRRAGAAGPDVARPLLRAGLLLDPAGPAGWPPGPGDLRGSAGTDAGRGAPPGGRLLVVEPRIHVGGAAFERSVEVALGAGLAPVARPDVALSRAVVLADQLRDPEGNPPSLAMSTQQRHRTPGRRRVKGHPESSAGQQA